MKPLTPWDVFVVAQHFRALAEGRTALAALEPLARCPEHMGLLSAGAEHARTIAVAAVARAEFGSRSSVKGACPRCARG